MYLTSAQLSSLRTRPHRTRLHLAVYQPQTVWSAKINHPSIAKGTRTITVTGLSGNCVNVEKGMTCYISVNEGGRELGRLRVNGATSTTLSVAENSYKWINGWYLTVVRYHEPWAVFPRIVLDAANKPTFYKDYDMVYTNQNQYMMPVVCMGPNHASFLESYASGTYEQVWYTSSGSYDPTPAGSISSYDWAFEGGMPTGSIVSNPGYVEYTGSGYYITRLREVTANGVTGTGYRHIMILDRPENSYGGTNTPNVKWGFSSLSGDRESGGYDLSIWIRENMDISKISEGSLIVVFSEDWEGGIAVNKIAANAEKRYQTFFVGYVREDSFYYNAIENRLEFSASSITGRMADLATFSATLESKENAMTWNELNTMTVDRAVVNFLQWQSTVMGLADFAPTHDTQQIKYSDFERGNLYDAINNYLLNTLFAQAVCDRQGKIWCEIDARVQLTGTSRQVANTMQNVIEVTDYDWRGQVELSEEDEATLAYVELGGIYYSGPTETGTYAAYLSGAPGECPDYWGDIERVQGIVCSSQDDLNIKSGYVFAMRNSGFPSVDVPLSGDYRFLDIAPQHRVLMTLASADTYRGINWSQKPFIPKSIDYEYMAELQALMMECGLMEETGGDVGFEKGATIEIPPDAPYDNWDLPYWDIEFPPIIIPDMWTPPIPDVDGWLDTDVWAICMADGGGGIGTKVLRTKNFNSGYPIWENISDGSISGTFGQLVLDKVNMDKAYLLSSYAIYYTENLMCTGTPTWHISLTLAEMRTLTAFAGGQWCGCLATSMAQEGYLCATVYADVAGSRWGYFIYTQDATAGVVGWQKSTSLGFYPIWSAGTDEYMCWVSDHSTQIVGCNFPNTNPLSFTFAHAYWEYSTDGGGSWTLNILSDEAFEDANRQQPYVPRRSADASEIFEATSRGACHCYLSTNFGVTFSSDIPAAVAGYKYSGCRRETIQESWFGGAPTFVAGLYQGASQVSGINYHNVSTNKMVSVAHSTSGNKYRDAYGYGIWPYSSNIQWISDGNSITKIYLTEDCWASQREIQGNAVSLVGGSAYFRYIQPLWRRSLA